LFQTTYGCFITFQCSEGENKLSFQLSHSWCWCAQEANTKIFYFNFDHRTKTRCKLHKQNFGYSSRRQRLFWGYFLASKRCLDWLYVFNLLLFSVVYVQWICLTVSGCHRLFAVGKHSNQIIQSSSSTSWLQIILDCTISDYLNAPCTADSDVQQAIRCLHHSKCIGADEIPNFITQGFSETLPL
jgi:hypothetical protein